SSASRYAAMPLVRIDVGQIRDWDTFHDVFEAAFGFPGFYGRNMHAWIDCMGYLDEPAAGMTKVHGSTSDPVVLRLDNIDSMPSEIYQALVECVAFVNWRRTESGGPAILVLAFYKSA
ncbi:MAG TPA: barstar family protein, partial [Tepidisphaeraceae bacterium]|nr:barstar family protein [Tepidisphaeraceae bacterium]